MTELLGARRLRELLERHGVRLKKELGQNFVVDPNTIRKVVDLARVSPGDRVLEIGAGAGSLTLGLAATGALVTALEFDQALLPVLRETLVDVDGVEIVQADAMRFDFARLGATSVVANLPYNIAVPVVMRVLSEAPNIGGMTVMIQKEVGERLAASPGTKAYGAVSVLVQYRAEATVVARVARRAFFPVPNVDSVIVRIKRRPGGAIEAAHLETVVRAAFSQRRKTLRNTLSPLAGGAARAEEAIARAGLEPGRRAEDVDLLGFLALARELP